MTEISFATGRADAVAAQTLQQEHAELLGALTTAVNQLTATLKEGGDDATARAVAGFTSWAGGALTPYLVGGEALSSAAAALPSTRAVAAVIAAARRRAGALSSLLAGAKDPFTAAAVARALAELVSVIVGGEDEHLLPALAQAPGVSLAELVEAAAEGAPRTAAPEAPATPAASDSAPVELDVREIPHDIRHATIFGALDAVAPGGSLVLIVHHDPIPLLMQLERRSPGAFVVGYLERGPEVWRLEFRREA